MAKFSAFDVERGKLLADEIVIALDNGRLYRELSDKVEELDTAKGEVAQARTRARAVMDTAQEAIVLSDKEGVVWDLNPKALEMLGRSREHTVGRSLADFAIPPRLRDGFRKHLETAYREGKDPVNGCLEVCALRENGEEFPLEISTAVIETPQGKILSTFAHEITARKQAEAEMAERHRLATLVADVGGVFTRAESLRQGLQQCAEIMVRSIGAACARVWTVKEGENVLELQASAGMYTHIDDGHARVPIGKLNIGRIAESGEPHLTNSVQEDPWVGDPEWARREGMVAFAGYPLKVEERVLGVVTAFARKPLTETTLQTFASVADNTAQFIKRKRAEEALRVSESRYRLLFERNLAGVFRGTLLSRGLLDCNDAYAHILGYDSRQEVLKGGKSHDFYDPAEFESTKARLLNEKALTNFETRLCRKDQTPIWVLANISLTMPEEGEEPLVEGTLFDITERKQAELALAQERDLLRALMDNVPDYIYFKDRQGRFVRTNRAHAKMFGFSDPAEVVGKTDFDFFTAQHAQPAFDDEQEVIRTGKPMAAKEEMETWPDGRVTWASTTKVPLRDARGNIVGTFGISRDVTERKQAEESLLLTQFSIEHASDAITWLDSQGHIVYVNKAACRSFGRTREELNFLAIADIDPDFPPGAWQKAWERTKAAGSLTFEARHITKLGQVFPVEITANYLEFGGKEYSFTFSRDITQRKEAERQINLQVTALKAAANGIVITDQEGRILWANPAFTRLTGYEAGEVAGQTPRVLKSGTQDKSFYKELWRTIRSGEVWQGELVNRRKDGTLYTEEMTITPVSDGTGAITHFIAIKQDVTERKQAEEKVRESNELVSLLLDSIPEAVYGIDMQGKCTFYNPSCLQLLGYREAADLHGKDMHALMHHTRQNGTPYPVEECHIFEAFRRGQGTHIDDEILWRRDGSNFPAEYWSRPIHRNGKIIGAVVTFVDITKRKQAEQQTRLQTAALESAANGIAIADREGRILWVNPAIARLTGYSPEEILGQTMRILNSGEQDAGFYQNLWQTILAGEVWKGEFVNRRKDGALYTDDTTITPVRDANGTVTHFVAIKQDATERQRAEQALEERTAYLNTLFEISPLGIVVVDTQGCIQMSNSAFERLFRYSRGEIVGAKLDDFIVPTELAAEAKILTALCLSGPGAYFTTYRRRKDRTLVDVDIYGVPLVIEGELRGVMGLYQDITERKRAEAGMVKYAEDLEASQAAQQEHAQELARLVEELAQERDLLGTVMDNLPDYIYYKDRQSRFLRTNRGLARVLGLSDPRQVVGKTDFDFFPEEDAKAYFSDEQHVIETGQPLIGRSERMRQPDGEYRWYSTSTVPIWDAQARVTGLVGITRDMTERMQAEEILRASEERYRELFENASDIVYTTGLDTRLTSLNRVGQQILGYSAEEATQLNLEQLVAPKHWGIIKLSRERLLAGDSDPTFEVEVTSKDGRQMMLEVKPRLIYRGGKPVGVQGIGRDITGRDAAELELRHAQKLESVGRLASGIAHEINTPIQFVGDNTRFLQDSFGGLQTLLTKYQELRDAADSGAVRPELLAEVRDVEEKSDCAYLLEEIPKALAQTLEGVTRVATIVRAMKEFAHPEGKEMAAADLNRALLSTLTVARNELKYVADVETEFGDLPLVVCNIGDLNQVFLNLLVNAAHAIDEAMKGTGKKGNIRVRTVPEGSTVLVTISDTGCGIPEANHTKVFDPFFTTKEVGRGTGQGLAIARSVVVDRHKGALTFESEVGKGTTFYIRLPVDPGECSKEAKAP